jgi:nuclear pore complex protein Nup98-Nup96
MRAFRWCSGNTFAQTVSEGDGIRISTCGVSDKLDEAVSKLNIFMNHSIISVTPDSGPQASLRSSLSAQELAKVSSHAIAEVWALASTLFDELPPFGEDVSAEARLALTRRLRKEAVSHWLTRSISDETQRDQVKPLTNIERIFVCLTGNQVSAACTLALSIGDVRLATLLALGNTDSAARADIHAQLESWQVDQSVSCIDAARYLIYRLLAGGVSDLQSVVVGLSNVSNIEAILDNLDWRRRFGLCLWFGTHNQEGLDIAMHQYEDTWLSDASIMPSSNVSDALGCQFHLLRLFTARGHGLDAIADSVAWQDSEWHSIEPWLMVEYLQARDAATLSDIRIDNLTIATSAQLETAGRYDFAIFVALFIKSPARQVFDNISYKLTTSRQSHILRLLAKLAPNLDASSEQFLQSRLQIPAAWIYQAKALQARYERRFLDEAHLLLSAGLADEAHQTLVREIGPECIVSGNLEPLVQILGGFTALETIQGWAEGGQVYQDAVSLALGGSQKSKAVIAAGVLDALPFMSTQTFLQKVAVSELMSLCMPISLSAKDKTRLQLPLASQAASFTAQAHLALQSSYSVKA